MSKKKVKRPKLGALVYVETDDIQHKSHGWQSFADIAKDRPAKFRFVGWVVRSTKRTLTVAAVSDSMKSDAYGFCHYLLPMRAITRLDLLK